MMYRLLICALFLSLFLPLEAIVEQSLAHEIEAQLKARNYYKIEQLLSQKSAEELIHFAHGKNQNNNEETTQLFQLFDACITYTGWKHNVKLFLFVDAALRKLSMLKLSPHLQKKFSQLLRIVQLESRSPKAVARMMGLEFSPEVLPIPKKTIGLRSKSKNEMIHVYKAAVKKQYAKWQKKHSQRSFSDYLKKSASKKEKRYMQNCIIAYLSSSEAEKYTVEFVDGKIKRQGAAVADGAYIFVLDAEAKRLFIGQKIVGSFHHSSFVQGSPVLCAGKLHIQNDEIVLVKLSSGHYKPFSEDGEKLRHYLSAPQRMGVKAATLEIGHFKR